MLVRVARMFDERLPPRRRPLSTDSAHALGGIASIPDGLLELLGGFHPRNHHAIRTDVERAFDEPAIEFRESDERDGFAANCRANVFRDLLPVEMPMLCVNDNPIQAQGDSHFCDGGGLQRNPKPECGPVGGESLSKYATSCCLHGEQTRA